MKMFLQGVSLGILFTTGVFAYVTLTSPPHIVIKEKKLTISKAKTFLESNHYLVQEGSSKKENGSVEENFGFKREVPKQPVIVPTVPKKEDKPTAVVKVQPTQQVKEYQLDVKEGMSSDIVAEILYKNGIVTNGLDFDKFLVSKGYSRKIQFGTYKLNAQMTYELIAKLITK